MMMMVKKKGQGSIDATELDELKFALATTTTFQECVLLLCSADVAMVVERGEGGGGEPDEMRRQDTKRRGCLDRE